MKQSHILSVVLLLIVQQQMTIRMFVRTFVHFRMTFFATKRPATLNLSLITSILTHMECSVFSREGQLYYKCVLTVTCLRVSILRASCLFVSVPCLTRTHLK
jgi:hypothetical protein